MSALQSLKRNAELQRRRLESLGHQERLRHAFSESLALKHENVTYFCAGSLGRQEAGRNSDLDIFVIAEPPPISKLAEVRLLAAIAELNDDMGFPPFSDELRYMKVYDIEQIIENTGKPRDDSENSFTTRMLLVLESASLANDVLYRNVIQKVCDNYFRDNKGKKDFRPLFLINDLLRYWRTLCLNYEQCRDDPEKPWRKKNVNLRFSRLTTVFSTVALLMVARPPKADAFIHYVPLTPLERLATALDILNDPGLISRYDVFLDHYTTFLRIKDSANPDRLLEKGGTKEKMRVSAEFVAEYFSDIFKHESLRDYHRFLLL